MSDVPPDLRTLLKAQLAAERERLDRHPSPEELEALQGGTLSPDEERRLRSHLPLCPECTDYLLALSELRGLDASPSEVTSPEEVRAAWTQLQPKLRREEIRPAGAPFPAISLHRWLLAAVLALAVVGLSFWSLFLYRDNQQLTRQIRDHGTAASGLSAQLENERRRTAVLTAREAERSRQIAELRRELDESLRPRINTPILDLAPRSLRGKDSSQTVPEIPRGSEVITLVLEPEDRRDFPAYSVEIFDSRGRSLWILEGLTKTEYGNFTLTLSREAVPAGEVRLRLYGVRNGQETEIGGYEVWTHPR